MVDIEETNVEENESTEVNDYQDRFLRLQLDFVNYKRRMEREREEQVKSANEELILKLLPVIDDLGRALRNVPDDLADSEWARGVAMVKRSLDTKLAEEGLTLIDPKGEEFDHEEHEAVFTEEGSERDQDKVNSVIRYGYKLHGKVIRPAQVSVIKGIQRPESPFARSQRVPIRRGGAPRWERPRVAPNARGTFF